MLKVYIKRSGNAPVVEVRMGDDWLHRQTCPDVDHAVIYATGIIEGLKVAHMVAAAPLSWRFED